MYDIKNSDLKDTGIASLTYIEHNSESTGFLPFYNSKSEDKINDVCSYKKNVMFTLPTNI